MRGCSVNHYPHYYKPKIVKETRKLYFVTKDTLVLKPACAGFVCVAPDF